MSKILESIVKSYSPAIDCGRYADRAARWAENKFKGEDGNEHIVAAMIIAQAIRHTSNDLVDALKDLESSIDSMQTIIDNNDPGSSLNDIRDAIDKLEGTVADVAARI